MAAPLLWIGVPQLAMHNLIFLSGFVLSGAGMFLLMRSLMDHVEFRKGGREVVLTKSCATSRRTSR